MDGRQGERVFSNALAAVAQTAVSSVLLWVMYRYLVNRMGVETLGIWSVVVALTTVGRLGDFGIGASVIRFVAHYTSRDEGHRVAAVIETASISVAAIGVPIVASVYLLGPWLLRRILDGEPLRIAMIILPYVLASLWINFVGNVCLGALDGLQRVDQRSLAVIAASTVQLAAVVSLVPVLGIQGLACAAVVQALTLTFVAWMFLWRHVEKLGIVPRHWTPDVLKELLKYGVSFQLTSVASLFCDPITKGLLTRFGGLAVTGYYELASRLLGQARAFILAAAQVVVPVIATLQERRPEGVRMLLRESHRALAYVAFPTFCLIAGMAPVIGELWVGRSERAFVLAVLIVGAGWLVNVLGSPAYFRNLGTGELTPNSLSQLATAVVNGLLGSILGWLWGYVGVLWAWSLALWAGTAVLMVAQHRRHERSSIAPQESWPLFAASAIGAALALKLYDAMRPGWTLAAVSVAVGSLLVPALIVPLWLHPLRKRLVAWAAKGLRGQQGTP